VATALQRLLPELRACAICEPHLPLGARPIFQLDRRAPIFIASQAPGRIAHERGRPFDDVSGDRLRGWLGVSRETFYDPACVAILPMGMCFPGTGTSGDLPPRPECAPLWHERILATLPDQRLTLLVGSYAQAHYLKTKNLTDAVRDFRALGPTFFPLPHPAWRSVIWMRRNPWFEKDVLPALRKAVRRALGGNKR
jgi:uracil-DNA glycosylase